MERKVLDFMTDKEVVSLGADLGDNPVIVETAGFVPLEVKLKRFEQAGQIMQFNTSEFTANDYRELYLNPDFQIYPDDDLEDVEEKLAGLRAYQAEVMSKIQKRNSPPTGENKSRVQEGATLVNKKDNSDLQAE